MLPEQKHPTVRLIPVAEFRYPAGPLSLSALLQMGTPPSASVSFPVKWGNGPGKVDGMLLGGQPYHKQVTYALHCPENRVKKPTTRKCLHQLFHSQGVDSSIFLSFVMDHGAVTPEYIIHAMMLHLEQFHSHTKAWLPTASCKGNRKCLKIEPKSMLLSVAMPKKPAMPSPAWPQQPRGVSGQPGSDCNITRESEVMCMHRVTP